MHIEAQPAPEAVARHITEPVTASFLERWTAGTRHTALQGLRADLDRIKRVVQPDVWQAIATETREGVGHVTSRDPLTVRCVEKPRGYAGDAPALDLIYLHERADDVVRSTDDDGRYIMQFLTNSPSCVCARDRRVVLADAIDAAAARTNNPNILSLACGHLREAELSLAMRDGRVGRFYAVDQDAESLAEVTETVGNYGVETVHMGLREILKGARPAQDLDLAYTAGLYDYLNDEIATATTSILFSMLRPGGRVLIANYAPSLVDAAYMEACMDWWLIYRDEADVRGLFGGIPHDQISSVRVWRDRTGDIVYGEAVKA